MADHRQALEELRRKRDEARKAEAERVARLREASQRRRKELDRRIRRAESRLAASERKLDTRRKILAGAWVLHEAERSKAAADKLRRGLEGFLERDADRELFDLPAREDPDA